MVLNRQSNNKIFSPMELLLLLFTFILYFIVLFHLYNFLIELETHPVLISLIIVVLTLPFSYPSYQFFIRFKERRLNSDLKSERIEIILNSTHHKTLLYKCSNCGLLVIHTVKKCPNCGAPIKDVL